MKKEVEMIGRILNNVPLTGKDATRDEVFKVRTLHSCLHITAHGRMETGEIALTADSTRQSKTPVEEDFICYDLA